MAQADNKQVKCIISWKQESGCSGPDGSTCVRFQWYDPEKSTPIGGSLLNWFLIPFKQSVKLGVYQNKDWSCCSGWTRIKVLFEGEFPEPDYDESLEVYVYTYERIIDAIEKANTPRGARFPC